MTDRRNAALALVLTAALMPACTDAGASPRAACEDAQAALCNRFYACFTPDELVAAGLPSSEAACVTMFADLAGCPAQTLDNVCPSNQTYHPDRATDCIDQLGALTCSQVRDGSMIDANTPACAAVCAIN